MNNNQVELICLPQTEHRPREKAGRYFWFPIFGEVYFVPKGRHNPDNDSFKYLPKARNNYEEAMKAAITLLNRKLKFEAIDSPSTVS